MNISKISPQEAVSILIQILKIDAEYWGNEQTLEAAQELPIAPGYREAIDEADRLLKAADIDFRKATKLDMEFGEDPRIDIIGDLYESMKDTLNNFSVLVTSTQIPENQTAYFSLFDKLVKLRDIAAENCTAVKFAYPTFNLLDEKKQQVLAEMIYETYCEAVGGKAYNGDTLPTASEFFADPAKQKQADAWRAAAVSAQLFFAMEDLPDSH